MTRLRRLIAGQLETGESKIAHSSLSKQNKQYVVLTDRRLVLLHKSSRRSVDVIWACALQEIAGLDHGSLNKRGHGTGGFSVEVKMRNIESEAGCVTLNAFGPAETSLYNLVWRLKRLRPGIRMSSMPRPRTAWRWVFVGAGVACLVVGILIGHGARIVWNEAHEPKTLALVDSQNCYVSQSDSGDQELCNVAVHFSVNGHHYRRTMGAIDAGDIYSGTILVAYQSSSPILIVPARENNDRLALLFGGFAACMLAFSYLCFRPLWRYRIDR